MHEKKIRFERFPLYPTPDDVDFTEISQKLRLNADSLMKEISEHVDKEIHRFSRKIKEMKDL